MISLCTTLILLAAPTASQTVGGNSETLYQWQGSNFGDEFGNSAANAGDVNLDGVDDYIIGSPFMDKPGGANTTGSATVYSGADGTLIYRWYGESNSDAFGDSVDGAGDYDGDGVPDLIVGAWAADFGALNGAGAAYIYSGATGILLQKWNGEAEDNFFGWSVAGVGDTNGDGFSEVVIGAWKNDSSLGDPYIGAAYLFSGSSGSILHKWSGGAAHDNLGQNVAGVGDVNGDGIGDIGIGIPGADPNGLQFAGSAHVYSGADYLLLLAWNGTAEYDFVGRTIVGVGDIDGDGMADIMVESDTSTFGGQTDNGNVALYSGGTGMEIFSWAGEGPGDSFGNALSSAGDFNADGTLDLLIGADGADAAYVYSGANGSLLHKFTASASGNGFGSCVAYAGDVNGDGRTDVLIGEVLADPPGQFNSGAAYVFSFVPYLEGNLSSVSAAAGGVLNLTLDFPTAAASYDYITLMSISGTGPLTYGVDIPLALDSYLLDSANGLYPFAITSNLHGTLNASGDGSASITFPAGAFGFAVGGTFWLATVAMPSGQIPAYSSVAVPVTFTP